MSNQRPKEWISAVLSRFDSLLESSVTKNVSLPSQLEEHKACLINTSQSKCCTVISGLTTSLKKLFSIRIYGERQELNLYNAQIIVLDVLEKCITSKDSCLLEESNLMRQLLPEICQLLYQPSNDKPVLAQLQASASRVLYCISQHNFNAVFNKISTKLRDLTLNTDDASDFSDLELIHHIYIDLSRITKLLEEIGSKFRNLRKPAQMSLAGSLDKALWKWLCSYPTELNLLYQSEATPASSRQSSLENVASLSTTTTEERQSKVHQLSVAAEKLFDLLDVMTEGSKKKAVSCWPLQTMLLVFCPGLLRQIVNGHESPKTGKHELLNQLRKVVSGRHIVESCADSYIRLLKAATCIQTQNYKRSALYKLVNGFLSDLQIYLFENGSKYFIKTLDQDALIECFVSSFRLHPEKDNLVKLCASTNSSIHHKMTLVQAMHYISTQPYLDWWPRIESLYNYGPNVRKIFHDCVEKVQAQVHTSPRSSQSLREKMERMNVGLKRSQDELPGHKDLLLVILQLIQGNPSILLKDLGSCSQEVHGTAMKFFTALASLFTVHNTANLPLSFECLGALLRLHDPLIIPMWNPESPISTLWDVSSTVLYSICETLLRHQLTTSPEKSSHAIKWIHEILTCRSAFFLGNQEKNVFNYKSELVKKAQLKLETTLLAHLWNSNSEVIMLTLSCFQCLHEEFEMSFSTGRSFPDHLNTYHELASITMLNEGETIQEKVTNVLRCVHKFPSAALLAWEDLREKWEKRLSSTNKQGKEDVSSASVISAGDSPVGSKSLSRKSLHNQQEVLDWVNMTRCLCALGGACAKISESTGSSNRRVSTSSHGTSPPSGSPEIPINHRTLPGVRPPVPVTRQSKYLSKILNFLSGFNFRTVDVSNSMRELLGSSLHPALFPTLFQQIEAFLIECLLDPANSSHIISNKTNDKIIEHLIVILRKIFENCSDRDAEYLSEESMEIMILQIVRYVRHTGTSTFAVQLRIKFCKMISEMMKRKNDLFFLSEIDFRNQLVEHLTDWIMASANQQVVVEKAMLRYSVAKALLLSLLKMLVSVAIDCLEPECHHDLDESAIVAVGSLLNGLPLHPDEGDGGDVPQAKSQLFLKYFTLFMKLLSEWADELRGGERIDENVVASKQTATLRKALIVAMSNLLSANIEYGLVHAMSLAYHNDVQTRAAFLEVLIKILQQGTAGFKSLGDSVLAERFERLVELVTMMGDNGELPIANALANVVHTTYMDELARVFVTLFDAKHLLYQLLWNMFSKEVDESDSVQTLFRGNSLASKIMTFCFKVYGASYLHNLIGPLVLWSLSPEISALQFEIDQKRIPAGVDIVQCRANLQRLTERFFSRIMTSTDKFPPQLKSVCHCLYQVVSQRFHESGTGAVASAIFLRFLNPAIATPYDNGLCEKPLSPNLARAFKFMCKIMQNIANHVVFTKEEHMKHFNDFVRARFDVCQQFFMRISTPECSSIDNVVHNTTYVNDTNVAALHRLLWNDQKKIGLFLAKSRTAKAVGRRPFDKMVTLLAYLGPPEYTRPVLETRITGQNISPCEFEQLMIRRKVTDSKEYKMAKSLNIFYQFGRSKMGYPVFYYIARRYLNIDIREDILKFYILQALKPYSARKFDIVFDLTQVGDKNSLRHLCSWLAAFPFSVYKNLDGIYIYNPNTWFVEYVSYNKETFSRLKSHRRFHFIEALSDLQKFIDTDHQKIPSATRNLDDDLTCFLHAYKSGTTKVDIKVGSKAVQIVAVDRVKLLDQDVILKDIYYSHQIESPQPSSECLNGFTLSANNSVLLFTHPDANKIIESIRHIRTRWELTQPVQDISTHHTISAQDVPGTLLNMALLNLGCSHPMVRSCAYNLLCCLTQSFNLQLEGRLYQSDGLCIPANNTLFIASISSTLAKNESHLTLEFVKECIAGFCCSSDKLKNLCLEYMEPWLFNLPHFISYNEIDRNKVKAIIYQLIELTIAEKNFYPSVQTKIWGNIGRMSDVTELVLECFFDASVQAGLGSVKAEIMADTAVALATHNMKLVSRKIINRLCYIVDKTALRPTPTLEKHKHWDEIAILARYLLMLSFNNNLDVVTHLPYLFHLVSLLLSTGPLSLRASIHGLVVNIIHSILTCRNLECKDETQQILRLSLTEFCLPKFYQFFGIPNVASAADTAFKSESFIHVPPPVGSLSHSSSSMLCGEKTEEDAVNLSFLDVVADALLEVLEACVRDVPLLSWLSEWQELSDKFAFQYNPSLQPRALVVLGCISKKASLPQIKQILGILGRSLESQVDPVLLEATILCLTRLQLFLKAPNEFHCMFFWIGICAMQMNEKNLYAAGLSLIEQNLHNLDEMGALALQNFSIFLMKCRPLVEGHFKHLETAVNVSFQSSFHYAFVAHLIKGYRHPDSLVTTRVVRVLDFSLELLSRYKNCHKYNVNVDSAPYLAALLPMSPEVRRHCLPRKKQDSSTDSHKSNGSSKLSTAPRVHPPSVNGHSPNLLLDGSNDSDTPSNGSLSSRNLPAPIPEDEEMLTSPLPRASVTSSDSRIGREGKGLRRNSTRTDNYECGTTPPKLRKIVDGAQDSDSSTSSGSHLTSSSVGSHRKHSSEPGCNVLLDDEVLDQKSQALLLTLLAAQINHASSNIGVEIVYEYLAQASVSFPSVFPIIYSLLDQKISNVLQHCDNSSILTHVQAVVHNALLSADREQTHRQISFLEGIGFGGIWRLTGPFGKVPILDNASYFVKLVDQFVSSYLSDISDLTSGPSHHSLNSDLSATSADDVLDSGSEMEHEDLMRELTSPPQVSPPLGGSAKGGSFRNKKPNLTIKVVPT